MTRAQIRLMEDAMQTMHDVCNAQDFWQDCQVCPFSRYCDKLIDAARVQMYDPDSDVQVNDYIPLNWEIKEKKNETP